MPFIAIAENKRHLTDLKGQPFFMVGANYEGYFDRCWRMWDDNLYNPDLIAYDFRKMYNSGLNVVRLFVLPALEQNLRANNFAKLDRVIQIAADNKLLVLLTFNDSHSLDLTYAAALDARIADRYQDDPIILGWDLENEPRFYNFAGAIYPPGHPAPVQTSQLIDHYGSRVSQQAAIERQNRRQIPAHLSPLLAYYYANGLEYFIEFANEATTWANQTGRTIVDYIYDQASARWQQLIEVLDGTVAAWLAARLDPVRAADPNHLITLGYNWLYFAGLAANRRLDLHQFHQYSTASLSQLNQTSAAMTGLQKAFPNQPLFMGEFGFSNHSTANPATSRPIPEDFTALFETALMAYLRANGFAGGLKWMLNDVDASSNPYEASFGIYRKGDQPKPIRDLLAQFAWDWRLPPEAGRLRLIQDPVGLALRFDLGQKIMLSGGVYQDESFSWRAEGIGHCFIDLAEETLNLRGRGSGQFAVDPWEIIPNWERGHQAILYQIIRNNPVQQATFPADTHVTWSIVSGATYRLTMGARTQPPADTEPEITPNPGEHVVLLANANEALHQALPYIRQFAPDLTFNAEQVPGRWAYVTVIANQTQIADDRLAAIRAAGAQIVDRIAGDVAAILTNLVTHNRRFLTNELAPPTTDPPLDPPTGGPNNQPALYTVQPGDSLSGIATKVYGRSSLWTLIFDANRDSLDSPSLIRPGMQLKIPPQS